MHQFFLQCKKSLVTTRDSFLEIKRIDVDKLDLAEMSDIAYQRIVPSKGLGDTAIGIILFILAFIGALVNLPSFLLLPAESIYQRIIWRYAVLALLISPKFLYDVMVNITSLWSILLANIFPIFFLSLLNTAYVYMIYFAVRHTFVAHTLLLCSISTTFISTWKIIRSDKYTAVEYIGIGINVFGAYLCCCEGAPLDSIIIVSLFLGKDILMGNFMAIAASAVYAVYASLAKPIGVTDKCPISVYLMLMSGYVVGLSFILAFIFGERIDIFSTDDVYGLFAFIVTW